MVFDRERIAQEVREEIERLQRVLAELVGEEPQARGRGVQFPRLERKRKPLTSAARERISEAQKKRWAERKKGAKKKAGKGGGQGGEGGDSSRS